MWSSAQSRPVQTPFACSPVLDALCRKLSSNLSAVHRPIGTSCMFAATCLSASPLLSSVPRMARHRELRVSAERGAGANLPRKDRPRRLRAWQIATHATIGRKHSSRPRRARRDFKYTSIGLIACFVGPVGVQAFGLPARCKGAVKHLWSAAVARSGRESTSHNDQNR